MGEASLESVLVDLATERGRAILMGSEFGDFLRLSGSLDGQENKSFCGVASSVAVLNAMRIDQPESDRHSGNRFYTQSNYFERLPASLMRREVVEDEGMSLEQLGRGLELHGARAAWFLADSFAGLEACREKLVAAVLDPEAMVIVNYARGKVGQRGGGHHSPLGAYSAEHDMFLLADVARYLNPPGWLTSEALYRSMLPEEDVAEPFSRGFVVVRGG